jgi:hypothetical protein
MLNERDAILKVNQYISQAGYGPEYRIYGSQNTRFGWVFHWLPKDPSKALGVSYSPYICHRNGVVKMWADICNKYRLNANDTNGVLRAFQQEAERTIRQ